MTDSLDLTAAPKAWAGVEMAVALMDDDAPPDMPIPLGESAHGARYRVVCIACRQDVTISHGAQAPHIDLTAYRCLRCRS